jgi:negative regulator of flagellin synthesis FlgM
MDIRSDVDGLKTLLGVPSTVPTQTHPAKNGEPSGASAFAGDRATLSNVGSGISEAASGSDARMEKVAAVQAAIAAGNYSVPASAVAGKVVDAMLSSGQSDE